jgi:hypothetical protein
MDGDIIEHLMVPLGYDPREIESSVRSLAYNDAAATYMLLRDRKEKYPELHHAEMGGM